MLVGCAANGFTFLGAIRTLARAPVHSQHLSLRFFPP